MVRLVSEVDIAEDHVNNADTGSIVRLVLSYADKGMWDFKVRLANGHTYSVSRLVHRWHLSRYVNYQPQEEGIL